MPITLIIITYCTNTNGVSMDINGGFSEYDFGKEMQEKLESMRTDIIDELVDDTDDDGYYVGRLNDAEMAIRRIVAESFPDANMFVEVDDITS